MHIGHFSLLLLLTIYMEHKDLGVNSLSSLLRFPFNLIIFLPKKKHPDKEERTATSLATGKTIMLINFSVHCIFQLGIQK